MATPTFAYQELFETGADDTAYRRLTAEHVSVQTFQGKDVLCVEPQALTLLADQAFHDINFFLRPRTFLRAAAARSLHLPSGEAEDSLPSSCKISCTFRNCSAEG